jgi:hypothetical protein
MAFKLPAKNFFRRTAGPAAYSRPSDWPVITDAAAEVQFLFCDLGDASCQIRTTFSRTTGSQNITIDWGDGNANVISTLNTITTHTYTVGTGTASTLGYTTFKIRVYFTGTGTSVLSNCNIMSIPVTGFSNSFSNCAVLEAYYGNSTQTSTAVNFNSLAQSTSSLSYYQNLQFVKLPATVTWTSWNSIFANCTSLVKVVMPTSNSAMNDIQNVFSGCVNLLECIFPSNSTGITSMTSSFNSCYNLRSVTLPPTMNLCTSFSQTFWECYNLRSITLPSINTCSTLQYAFISCKLLEWVKFTSMPTVTGAINMSLTFNGCNNLQFVYFPATGTATSIYNFNSLFASCPQLKSIVFPSNINVSDFGSTFNSCYALTSCILPTSAAACTNYASMFASCYSLLKITLPAAATANVSFASTFSSCWKLEQITIPAGYKFTDMNSVCSQCFSLKTFTWTPGIQNTITSLQNSFFNCYLLTSITMPSSMTALTSLTQTFYGCQMLLSVTLPSSLNLCTNMGSTFAFCKMLKNVTLPTSMSVCTNFFQAFTGCKIIESITLPNIVGNVTTMGNAFGECHSLKTCVLPGNAQLSLVTNIDGMFNRCSNLKTITNFEKIGSLTATPLMSANSMIYNRFTSGSAISFSGPLSKLDLSGINGFNTDVQAVRLTNASAGQWTGSSPQINISYTNMSTAQIVQLFNDIAAQGNVSSKTINISSASGVNANFTAAHRQIVTTKGWTITG